MVVQYLGRGAVRETWVGFKGDHLRANYGFEFFRRHGTKMQGNHDVHFTMALQDREVLVAARRLWDRHSRDWPCPHWKCMYCSLFRPFGPHAIKKPQAVGAVNEFKGLCSLCKYRENESSKSTVKIKVKRQKNHKTVPMGNSCEVVASSWGLQRRPTDAGRSRRCTRTGPHPEEEANRERKRGTEVYCMH